MPPALANSHWIRTASGGWTSLSPSLLPHSVAYPGVISPGGIQQLPFPQYPPVSYQPPFASCGIPGCRREAVNYRARPALVDSWRFEEIFEEQRSPRSRAPSCPARRRVSFSDTEQEGPVRASSSGRSVSISSTSRRVYRTDVRLDEEE